MNRFELRTGKFGFYFYDKQIKIDLSLDMILKKLNYFHNDSIKDKDLIFKISRDLEKLKIEYRKLLLKDVI